LCEPRESQRLHGQHRRKNATLKQFPIAFLLVLLACSGKKPSGQDLFERIRLTFLQGNLAKARVEADQACQRFSGDPEWAWRFRTLKAEILANQGLSKEVLSSLDVELPRSLLGNDVNVRKHMLEALAYSHLGRFSEADQSLGEAEQLCTHSRCAVMGEVARIAGVLEADRDDADKAEVFFRRSLQIARQQGERFLESSALLNLGVVALGKEHFDESIDWSRAASESSHALHAGLTEEKALGNLGWAYYKMGDFERALDLFVAATNRSLELGAVIDRVEWLNNQGLVYFQLGQLPVAEKLYLQSLELARSTQNQAQIVAALNALAFVSAKTGHSDVATSYSDEAFQLSRQQGDRANELYALLVRGQIAAQSNHPERAQQLFSEVARDPKADTSLRWEAQDELAKLYASAGEVDAANKQYLESLATLEAARASLRHEEFRLPFLANAVHLYNDYVSFLVKHGKAEQALEVADYSRAQTLLEGLGVPGKPAFRTRMLNAHKVADIVNATILFYWLAPGESYLWAITPRQTRLFRLPSEAEIEMLVKKYRKALIGPADPLKTANPDGMKLFDALVAPAEKFISRNSRVVIIPDGDLNHLNFETLLVAKPSLRYWIEDVTISNANSLRLLSTSDGRHTAPSRNLLLIGDAVSSADQYRELPNASREMKSIESHFSENERTIMARDEATPAAYLTSKPEQFAYIHFVAHGTASELSPLDSAIVLSRSTPADDSFKLYARKIIQHPLRADLVTVSSCYGQGTRAYTGEGLVGLSWAFLRAGARNVVGALWEVSDTSTPQLMDQLYSRLEQGTDPALALREAKLAMLHSDGVFRKPFYWAPFQLYIGF
jgi:CHAT domain-containing protein